MARREERTIGDIAREIRDEATHQLRGFPGIMLLLTRVQRVRYPRLRVGRSSYLCRADLCRRQGSYHRG